MHRKVFHSLRNIFVALIIPLTVACQGASDTEIDPGLIEHIKSIFDLYSDCGESLQVFQSDNRKVHVYSICPKQGGFCFDTGRNGDFRFVLPTNAMKYKDKYILFYLQGKEILSEKEICNILGIASEDDMPHYSEIDSRIWIYARDKKTKKTAFVQIEFGTNSFEYPQLRYLSESAQDSATIDMVVNNMEVHGEKGRSERFSAPDKLLIGISIFNKSDSILLIGLDSHLYGSFIMKNGKREMPLTAEVEINEHYDNFHEYSPGLYSIMPHGRMDLSLTSLQQSIILDGIPQKEYARKLYDLFYDSIYYVPANLNQISDTVRKRVWDREFKVYYPMEQWYNFWVNDSIYNIYFEGESACVEKYRFQWFEE